MPVKNRVSKISKMINVGEEDNDKLQTIADEKRAVLLTFISPYPSVRVSPAESKSATIGLIEEISIEEALEQINERMEGELEKLFLLVNSPGGAMSSSYKIAHILQQRFSKIKTFIPHIAASGGTIIALTGEEITFGTIGHITPLDVQINYKGTKVSATSMLEAKRRLNQEFSDKLPKEAPYPQRAMTEKLDPIIFEEWQSSLREAFQYVEEILKNANYEKEERRKIGEELVLNAYSHGHVINKERAEQLGVKLDQSEETEKILKIMRRWFRNYAVQPDVRHIIRYVLPSNNEQD